MRTIAHMSDIHFGRIDPPVLEGLFDDLAHRSPSLLVLSGDLTQRARAGQYMEAAAFLRRMPQPQLIVPGNHDIPLYNLLRRAFSPLGRYQKFIAADLRPSYCDDEIFAIGINTARPFTFGRGFWKDGSISDAQLLDLRMRSLNLPRRLFKIAVTHHPFVPPIPSAIHDIVHRAPLALATLEQCGFDLLLAGHLHSSYHADVRTHHTAIQRSMISLQAGSAASTRRRSNANAYNWITIEPDQLTIDVRAWNGSAFASAALTRLRRTADGWIPDDLQIPTEVPAPRQQP